VGRPGAETEAWVRSTFDVLTRTAGVSRVGLALAEGGGRRLSFTASDRDHRETTDWCEVDAYDDVPLNNTIRTGKLILGSLDELVGRYPTFVGRQEPSTCALASVPLVAAGQVMGGFVLFFDSEPPFDLLQRTELERLGEQLGEALRLGQRATALPSRSLGDEAVPEGGRVATYVATAEPQAVATARRFTEETLTGWHLHDDPVDVAVLCVSELVTNAIIHTVAGCEVRLLLHDGVLTISVRDAGTGGWRAEPPSDDPLAGHGRGLQLVEMISTRWGSELDTVGMTVWCEIALT
jgi:anti-sigma regulatory factor (Ser/Thr protein kinase)